MYSLARRFIKTAIIYLFIGLGIGGWMIVRRDLWGRFPTPYETSAHTHAVFVGFVMMMILGVALWLFPRPEKTDRRYRPALVEFSYWLLTTATGARIVGELMRGATQSIWLRGTIVTCGMLQIVGFVVFFLTMWSRIRPAGSQAREAKGERF